MNQPKDIKTHPLGTNAKDFEIPRDSGVKIINEAEACVECSHHHISDALDDALHARAGRVEDELINGFHAIREYPKSVTIFGSARFKEGSEYYEKARSLSQKVCRIGFAVITGGGPGIMEGANKGTREVCGYSVGFNIQLPNEQVINPYVTHGVNFHYFFARKVSLAFSAEAYVYFPGGFGTLDEFFEILTLIQTNKIPPVPVILIGSEYWKPLEEFIQKVQLEKFKTISPEDVNLYTITDDEQEALDIIKTAKLRSEY